MMTKEPLLDPSLANKSEKPTGVPVSFPTGVPSSLPTAVPSASASPSAVPSAFEYVLTPLGDYDPSSYLQLAHPSLTVSSGFAYALAAEKMNRTLASRSFGLLFGGAPGSDFDFTVSIGIEEPLVGGGGGSTIKEIAAALDLVLKTATVYSETSTVEAAYQIRDAAGRTQVLPDDLSVELVVTPDASDATFRFDCMAPSSISGIGTCSATADASWFSSGSTMQVCGDLFSFNACV